MKYINEKTIIIAGVWLVILPYTGFPGSWKTVFIIITGLILLYVGIAQLKKKKQSDVAKNPEVKTGTFTEVA